MAELVEKLCNIGGVSGDEGDVREFIRSYIKEYVDELTVDSMGNLIALKKGKSDAKRIMLSAHMDEVGFIISGFTEKGYLEFKTVGGIDTRVIISKKVFIGKNKVPGIIGIKAVHLQKPSERESVPSVSSLYIDIGASSKDEAKSKVSLGDYAVFDTKFSSFGTDKFKAKAIDDRIGCAVLMNAIKKDVKYDTYFCFMTQEEVGLRGARIAASRVCADIALVVEATTCSDIHGVTEENYVTTLGGGAVITTRDRSTIVPDDYQKKLIKLAEDNKIPYQYKKSTSGGNDAGAIHITGEGVKTASVSLPCRYIHSPIGVASYSDYESVKKLINAYIDNIDEFVSEEK